MARIYAGVPYSHDPETVVLHHCRKKSLFRMGTSQKPPDMFGAWVCAKCHEIIHNPGEIGSSQIAIYEYEAILRTQYELLKEGKI